MDKLKEPAASSPEQQDMARRKFEQCLAWELFVEDTSLTYLPNHGPRRVAQLFGSFASEKLKLVQSIGFDCCLRLPIHHHPDDAFYVAILKKIDPDASCLRLAYSDIANSSNQVVFRDEDINLVLGLPYVGAEVESEGEVSMEDVNAVRKILGLHSSNAKLTIEYIENILTREYSFPMTDPEETAFKVAVVIYTMVKFLAVQAGSKRIPIEIFGSLANPSRIRHVNWSGHVRRNLMSEARKVQEMLKRGVKIIQPGGCSLYTKVHYLDNLQFEDLQLHEKVFPRALVFTEDAMNLAIRLDSIRPKGGGSREFGQAWLKREAEVCYSRRSLPSGYEVSERTTSSSCKKRKGDQTIEQLEHGCRRITMSTVILEASAIHIFSKGDWNIFSKGYEKTKLRISPLATKIEAEGLHITGNPIPDGRSSQAISPFEIIFNHDDAPHHKWLKFFDILKKGAVSNLERDWFVHSDPTNISIRGWELRAAMIPGGYFSVTITNAVLRVYVSRDNAMYALKPKRWRHFIPASWAHAVMYGNFALTTLSQMNFFVGAHILYELRYCRMFTLPVNWDGSWSCYFWDIPNKQIIVLDPQMQMGRREDIHDRHGSLAKVLHKHLFLMINKLFPEWDISRKNWGRVYPNDVSPRCKWGESGLYTLHYAQHYNGIRLTVPVNEGCQNNRRAQMIWMMLVLGGNAGTVPHEFGLLKYKS